MEENLKQRLVGAAVLAALAVIFLPALFDRDERVALDTVTQIPPAPIVEPVVIPKPTKPESVAVPPADQLFQPVVDEPKEKDASLGKSSEPESPKKAEEPIKSEKTEGKNAEKVEPQKPVPSEPSLNASGVPKGWVVQTASFKSSDSANQFTAKLIKAKYKAYTQDVITTKGKFYRVLVGPYIDEAKALAAKDDIDKAYKLTSKVLRFNPISGD